MASRVAPESHPSAHFFPLSPETCKSLLFTGRWFPSSSSPDPKSHFLPSHSHSLCTGWATSTITITTVNSPYLYLQVGIPGDEQVDRGTETKRMSSLSGNAALAWRIWKKEKKASPSDLDRNSQSWRSLPSELGKANNFELEMSGYMNRPKSVGKLIKIFDEDEGDVVSDDRNAEEIEEEEKEFIERRVEIALVHWGWILKVDGFWLNRPSSLIPTIPIPLRPSSPPQQPQQQSDLSSSSSPDHHLLIISDSIAVAFSPSLIPSSIAENPKNLITRGSDDAWSLVGRRELVQRKSSRLLNDKNMNNTGSGEDKEKRNGDGDNDPFGWDDLVVEVIAYPGALLTDREFKEGNPKPGYQIARKKKSTNREDDGMFIKFWRMVPWNIPSISHPFWSPSIQSELDEQLGIKRISDSPDTILISLGTNDRGWMIPPTQFIANLRQMVKDVLDIFGSAPNSILKHIVILPPADHPNTVELDKLCRFNPEDSFRDAIRFFISSAQPLPTVPRPHPSSEEILSQIPSTNESPFGPPMDLTIEGGSLGRGRGNGNAVRDDVSLHYCDVNVGSGRKEFLLDGLHPGKQGHEKVGKEIAEWLGELWTVG